MTIPKKLKIFGFVWNVSEDKNVTCEGNCNGSTHYGSQSIFIDPEITKQKKEEVLIHESMHAIWWQSGLGKRYTDTKMEEEIIHAVAHGIYQVLNDNKLLK